MAMTILLPSSLDWLVPFIMYSPLVLAKAVIAIPVAYFAHRKGYGRWEFYFAAFLLGPLPCIALLLSLPKIAHGRVVKGGD